MVEMPVSTGARARLQKVNDINGYGVLAKDKKEGGGGE
jgi:hypothetical protein